MKKILAVCIFLFLLTFYYIGDNLLEKYFDASDLGNRQAPSAKVINSEYELPIEIPRARKNEKFVCQNFSFSVGDTNSWKQDQKEKVSQFIKSLTRSNVSRTVLDQTYISSGIGWTYGRAMERSDALNLTLPTYMEERLSYSSFEQLILDYIARKDYNGLLKFYIDKPEELNRLLYTGDGQGLPIVSALVKNQSNDKEFEKTYWLIKQLAGLGEKVRYIDLVTATQYHSNIQFTEQLYALSGLKSDKIFDVYSDYVSFATIASRSNNLPGLIYWLNQGSAPNPDLLTSNALDLLQGPDSLANFELHKNAFLALMNQKVQANSELTYSSLAQWVPSDLLSKYESQINSDRVSTLSERDSKLVKDYVIEISDIVTEQGSILPKFDRDNEKCVRFAATKLIDIIFELSDSEPTSITKQKSIDSFEEKALKIIEDFKSTEEEETITLALRDRKDLVGKIAYAQIFRESVLDKIRKRKQSFPDNRPISETESLLSKLIYQDNDYHLAKDFLERSDFEKDARLAWLSIILKEVVNNQFEESLISELITAGAYLNPMHLFTLIENHELKQIRFLQSKGLNIHFLHPYGRNAVWFSVKVKSIELLRYFITSGVEVNLQPHGVDALDIALLQVGELEHGIDYVDLLINHGMIIHSSHRQRLQEIKKTSPFIYSLLTGRHPKLL